MNDVKVQKKKHRSARGKRSHGAIFSLLYALYAFFYSKAQTSAAAKVMCNYDKTEKAFSDGGLRSLKDKLLPDDKILSVRRKISKRLCKNPLSGITSRLLGYIISCRCRDIGIFMMSFSIYSALTCAIKPYIYLTELDVMSLVASAVCALVSIPFIIQKISFGEFAVQSKILHFLLFDMLGARDYEIYGVPAKQAPSGIALICGMLLGLLGLAAPVYTVILMFVSFLGIIAICRMPETGVVILLLIFPFAGSTVLSSAVLITLASYTFKVLQLKRTLKFTYSDLWVLLFALCVLFGGIISPGGSAAMSYALYMCFGVLCLFVSKNLIRSFEWISRCFMACILSLTLTCLCAAVTILTSGNDGILRSVLECAVNGVSSTLHTNSEFALYIAAMLPFVMLISTSERKKNGTSVYFTVILLAVISLIFTSSAGGYIACGAVVCLFLFMRNERTFARGVIGAFPVVAFIAVLSQFRGTTLFNAWDSGVELAKANGDALSNILSYPLGGMGITTEASGNASFYLILTEALGIPCLFVFASVAVRFFRICLTALHGGFNGISTSLSTPYITSPMLSVLAILIFGCLSGVPFDGGYITLMFLIMGIGEGIAEFSREDAMLASGFGASG